MGTPCQKQEKEKCHARSWKQKQQKCRRLLSANPSDRLRRLDDCNVQFPQRLRRYAVILCDSPSNPYESTALAAPAPARPASWGCARLGLSKYRIDSSGPPDSCSGDARAAASPPPPLPPQVSGRPVTAGPACPGISALQVTRPSRQPLAGLGASRALAGGWLGACSCQSSSDSVSESRCSLRTASGTLAGLHPASHGPGP